MQKIYTDLSLDFRDGRSLSATHVTQGDKSGGRTLRIALYNNGERININSENDTATLLASCGDVITEAGKPCTISDNRVIVPILDNLTQMAGIEHCTIRIESTNGRVHVARFDLIVGKSPISPDMPELVATADIVEQVDDLSDQVENFEVNMGDTFKNYLITAFEVVHPEYITRRHVDVPILEDDEVYYCTISKSEFDPLKDGVMIWAGYVLLMPVYSSYTFDTDSDPDNVIVIFGESSLNIIEAFGYKATIVTYQKSPSAPQTYGTSAVYAPLGLSTSTIATSMTDLTPNLKSVSDTSDAVRSSIDLGWLCTNTGGVAVIFVMHRCGVSISDGVGGVWQQISITHNTQDEDADYSLHGMSVFWRQVDGNIPLHITVTAADSQHLYASAVIYEGKTSVALVERTNEVTYETLYYNVTDQKDGFVSGPSVSGIDMWCLTVEYLNNYWVTALDTNYDPSDSEGSHPDSGETDRLSIYAGGGTRCIYYVNENAQCKNYLGFYIARNNITNSDFESAVQFLHVLIT